MVAISWLPELLYNDAALAVFSIQQLKNLTQDCQVTWWQADNVFARNKVWNFVLSAVFPLFINSVQTMQTQLGTARGEKMKGSEA